MGWLMKKLIWSWFLLTLAVTVFNGCRTAEGFGEDVERAGQKIQKEAK